MFVHPGEFVGTSEEFLPCPGLYEEDGKLYASATGEIEIDPKGHTVKVMPKTRVPKLQAVKTVTYGVVAEASGQVAVIDLVPIKLKNLEYVPNGVSAILHISNIKKDYVEAMSDELRAGDIIRVAIIEVSSHTIRLTTDGKELGVVKAYCSRCRNALELRGTKLECPKCGSIETRKLAADYGGIE